MTSRTKLRDAGCEGGGTSSGSRWLRSCIAGGVESSFVDDLVDLSRVVVGAGVIELPRYSPIVIKVNSHCIPCSWYANCSGRLGREYRAVMVDFRDSA